MCVCLYMFINSVLGKLKDNLHIRQNEHDLAEQCDFKNIINAKLVKVFLKQHGSLKTRIIYI